MAVTKEIKYLDKSNVNLSITVPKEELRSKYQEMIKEYTKDVQIPGFRKGKVPQNVLERKYGDSLKNEALSRVIESAIHEIFEDKDLPRKEKPLPYSTPEMQEKPVFDFDQDLKFSLVYDVLPEVKINQYKGITVEYPYSEVTDDDINNELEEIRERNSFVLDRDDDAAAQKGDIVTIDFCTLDENGESQSDSERKDFSFTIGDKNNIYQFDDEIIGMKINESKEFEKKYPESHHDENCDHSHEEEQEGEHIEHLLNESLAGQQKKFKLTLKSLKEKKLPDLDDDLAQDVDEKYQTLDDLKNSIRKKIKDNIDKKMKDIKTHELLKEIMKNTPVILPESMIKAELNNRMQRMARYYNIDVNSLIQLMFPEGQSEEKSKEWREATERALHSRVIIETLIEEQNFEITDNDVEKEFEKMAAETKTSIEEIKEKHDEESIFYLKEDIKEQRIMDILLAENTYNQGKRLNYLDFMAENG